LWWQKGSGGWNTAWPRSVNALTSQKLTDEGAGSTFYDNTVDVRLDKKIAGSSE